MSQITTFGTMPDGRAVERVTIRGGGLTASFLTFGATLQDLRLDGVDYPLVLGGEDLESYLGPMTWFGAIVGRFANRIAGGHVSVGAETWQTDLNETGRTTLHGGQDSSGRCLWAISDVAEDQVSFTLSMPDGHMGFPGNLEVTALCRLTEDSALDFEIRAITDVPTPCSFAHHSYFNLDGDGDVLGHRLWVDATHFLPVDAAGIPTGELRPVAGTNFDFRNMAVLGATGVDHNFCLSTRRVPLRPVARLAGQHGISMEVATTETGLQVYDGAHISGLVGLDGRVYGRNAGLALETQVWPDAPNQHGFPDWCLMPGETYRHHVRYRFTHWD